MDIGNKIVKYRKKNKISQEQLAEKIGVTRQTISNWELNVTKPDIIQIKNISKELNTSVDELIDNNVNNIVRNKITNIEKAVIINSRNIKILIISLYFILLTVSIGIIVYYTTKKDYTDEFQWVIACTIYDETFKDYSDTYYLYSNVNEDKTYSGIIELTENGVECGGKACEPMENAQYGQMVFDEYYAGESYLDAVETLNYFKRGFLHKGAVCR